MKSHIDVVLAVYEGILADISAHEPALTSSLEKDMSYLRRAAKDRGLQFFTVLLPEAGKVFDQLLSDESATVEWPKGYPLVQNRPKLFGDLYTRVFRDRKTMLADPDIVMISYLRQLFYCCKKYRLDCGKALVKEALLSFFEVEDQLPEPFEGTWNSEYPQWVTNRCFHPLSERDDRDGQSMYIEIDGVYFPWEQLWQICRFVTSEFGEPDWYTLEGRHGPGVVADQKGSFISKYDFPNWPVRLGNWFPYEWFGPGILDTEHSYSISEPLSRLIAVPKTQKGPRLICCEPIAHQWMQQSIWRWLSDRIGHTCLRHTVTFHSQQNSRDRALLGSQTGELSTIDLKEASDRMSARLVEYIFQGSPLLDAFHACRTRYVMQPIDDSVRKGCCFRKFAPMGSALTFPIQSIVFSTMAIWAVLIGKGESPNPTSIRSAARQVTVFGDDIIVPSTATEPLMKILHECGLRVNPQKTFWKGYFRESCGVDAYKGVDVTPSYLLSAYDGSATSMSSIIECSNNFHKRGLWRSAAVIAALLPEKERKLLRVVGGEVAGLGLFSFCGPSTSHLKVKWRSDYQREESIALSVTSKVTKRRGRDTSSLIQFYTECPTAQDPLIREPWEAGQVVKVSHRKVRQGVPS